MAATTTTTVSNTSGLAEDFEDMIYSVSPTETPFFTMAKKTKASGRYHQWQEDSLAAAANNKQAEGQEFSFATAAGTTTLGNYCQISSKTVDISRTLDIVQKYGRKSEIAYQLLKKGKELKRDVEYDCVRNQASANATVRASAGWECMISGNLVRANSAQTTDYSVGGFAAAAWTAPEDGSLATFVEANLISALGLAWDDGGDPSVIMMSKKNKNLFNSFAGIATKYNDVNNKAATIVANADVYISDFGNHTVRLNRYMRDQAVFCLDPEFVSVAILDGVKKTELAKVTDGTRYAMTMEWCLVVNNRDAHATIGGVGV